MSTQGELLPIAEIERRLKELIPSQADPRGFARREIAAKTVFVMLYGFAVEGEDRWIRPTAVTDMTDEQAGLQESSARRAWLDKVQSRDRPRQIKGRWYQENTREPIRDETLRTLVKLGIAIDRPGVATTSPKPRYALAADFAKVMKPDLVEEKLADALAHWRKKNLSAVMLARLALVRQGHGKSTERVLVRLPNGETRRLSPGPSAELTRAVIEIFAPNFLRDPAVILMSESAHKVGYQDAELMQSLHLEIDPQRTLPDVVLMDLAAHPAVLVFVECVVTDGPVDSRRKAELDALATQSGFEMSSFTCVTAFHDRVDSPFQRMASSLAWSSFVWFETEPDHIVHFRSGKPRQTSSLRDLLDLG